MSNLDICQKASCRPVSTGIHLYKYKKNICAVTIYIYMLFS